MDAEEIYRIWEILSNYINSKEKQNAIYEFLNYVYECDWADFNELKSYADEYDDELFVKCIKRFIKENDLGYDEE